MCSWYAKLLRLWFGSVYCIHINIIDIRRGQSVAPAAVLLDDGWVMEVSLEVRAQQALFRTVKQAMLPARCSATASSRVFEATSWQCKLGPMKSDQPIEQLVWHARKGVWHFMIAEGRSVGKRTFSTVHCGTLRLQERKYNQCLIWCHGDSCHKASRNKSTEIQVLYL